MTMGFTQAYFKKIIMYDLALNSRGSTLLRFYRIDAYIEMLF